MENYTVTFATMNCLDYTKQTIQSLLSSGIKASKIVAVDNGSTDDTPNYLSSLGIGSVILNRQNFSCGTAWNQGILAQQSEWTIVMNNDILVAPNFANKLVNFASKNNLQIVSPARIDGSNDYDFFKFAECAQQKTQNALRLGTSNAVCMCIHWSVFKKIGFFRANPNLLGFEDGIFFNDVRINNIPHATTGSVWIHHFGSITQDEIKKNLGIDKSNNLVHINDRRIYNQSWYERKLYRYNLVKNHKKWKLQELKEFGMTIHGARYLNKFIWL